MRDEYGDEAIGYVQVQSRPGSCVVKGRVTPEHRVNTAPYRVTVSINTVTGAIEEARCHDCQARNGGCKHVAAFLFWIHRRSSEKAVTDVTCYWTKPRLANIANLSPMKSTELGARKKASSNDDPDDFLDLVMKEVRVAGNKPSGVFFDMFGSGVSTSPQAVAYLEIHKG